MTCERWGGVEVDTLGVIGHRWVSENQGLTGRDRHSSADAKLWELIHQIGRDDLPGQPVIHPLSRPYAP